MYVYIYIDGDRWDGGGMRYRVYGKGKRGQEFSARYASRVVGEVCVWHALMM
jgi:hypothetical protein